MKSDQAKAIARGLIEDGIIPKPDWGGFRQDGSSTESREIDRITKSILDTVEYADEFSKPTAQEPEPVRSLAEACDDASDFDVDPDMGAH